MAETVPTNLNLMERLALQTRLTREEAVTLFPNALGVAPGDESFVPGDAVFYRIGIGGSAAVLVAHHSHSDGIGVWDLWTGDTYWSQLNRTGEAL